MKRTILLLFAALLLWLAAPTAFAEADAPQEHVFGDWYTVTAATCVEAGEERRDCADCDAFETREIPAGHSFGDWYAVTAATCAAAGEERRDCANCDAFETQEIPAGHSFGDWYTVTEPDCLTAGEQRRDCERCGEGETMALPPHGHSFVTDPEIPATCTTAGRTRSAHCEYCGAVLWPGPTTLKPLGHFLDENGDCKICGEHIKDLCPYCHKDHDGQLFGRLIAWLHKLLFRLQQTLSAF